MEEMYEVLRFIEHGAHCRQSMDCIRGKLLVHYLKEHQGIGKAELFRWFRQLGVCVDQYHRSRKQREYRYLNPYSIVVSEEGGLCLLDLEAPGNGDVLKQMQRPAVREGFVKPVCEMRAGGQSADLFAYGKTIQFLLAYTQTDADLTRWEEIRLSRVIDRCTGEAGKPYGDISQVLRDLPAVRVKKRAGVRSRDPGRSGERRKKLLAAASACTAVCAFLTLGNDGAASGGEIPGSAVDGGVLSGSAGTVCRHRPSPAARICLSAQAFPAARICLPAQTFPPVQICPPGSWRGKWTSLAAADRLLKEYAASEDLGELRGTLGMVREIELNAVWCLAETYDKLDMEEALETYERLIQIEKDPEKLEDALERKEELEAEGILEREEASGQQDAEMEEEEENIP